MCTILFPTPACCLVYCSVSRANWIQFLCLGWLCLVLLSLFGASAIINKQGRKPLGVGWLLCGLFCLFLAAGFGRGGGGERYFSVCFSWERASEDVVFKHAENTFIYIYTCMYNYEQSSLKIYLLWLIWFKWWSRVWKSCFQACWHVNGACGWLELFSGLLSFKWWMRAWTLSSGIRSFKWNKIEKEA